MQRSKAAMLATLWLTAACGSDGAPPQDAGSLPNLDGSTAADGGALHDGGREDAGFVEEDASLADAGTDASTGAHGDAGLEADAEGPDAASEDPSAPCAHPNFVTWVAPEPDSSWGSGQSDGRSALPDIVCGPPLEPKVNGAFHTASLGNGGTIILGFSTLIVDGPGVDFIVFENPFSPTYPELATVAVSSDGVQWYEFPCTAAYPTPGGNYGTCAGWHLVLGKQGDPASTWTNPETAGGDQYDLADLSLPDDVEGIRYVRITDREDQTPQVFDLDAVSIVNGK